MKFIFNFSKWGFEVGLLNRRAKETQVFFWFSIGYGRLPNKDALGLYLVADLLNFHLKEGGSFRVYKKILLAHYNWETNKYEIRKKSQR